MTVAALKWQQVNAWRLAQHGLAPRLKPSQLVEAVARTGGIQAQVASAAELALWARVDGLSANDVRSALWEKRTLVKTWAMRATIHLLSAADLPLYVAARSMYETRNWQAYFSYFGFTPDQSAAFIAAIPHILDAEPLTRGQLAVLAADQIGAPELAQKLLASSWGSLWKPSAWRGDLCFGPNQGQHPTFVNPSRWFGPWQPVEPFQALQEIARRYLRAYGPATPADFAMWWGLQRTRARKLFQSLAYELVEVEVEGWQAFALHSTLAPMQAAEPVHTFNMLPLFDAYVLGLDHDNELIVPRAYKRQIYRPQGWISAVILVDGNIRGVWEYKTKGGQTAAKIYLFAPLPPAHRAALEREAERLGAFLNTKVALEIEMA
jgi:hypothetical protein